MRSSHRSTRTEKLAGMFRTLGCRVILVVLGAAFVAAHTQAQVVTATLATGKGPGSVVVNPLTNKVYVADTDDTTVTLIDGLSDSTETIAVGLAPIDMAINPVTNKIYILNASADLTILDGTDNSTTVLAGAGAGYGGGAVVVNPVTNKIYVTRLRNTIAVIDGATNAVTTVAVGSSGAIAVNPVTNKIYVACGNCGNVNVVDGATSSVVPIKVGATKQVSLAINPATNKIYAVDGGGNVTVIDGATNGVTSVTSGSLTGGVVSPGALALNPVTNKIYVAVPGSGSVTVIDGATNSTTSVPAGGVGGGGGPSTVAVDSMTNQIYVTNNYDNTLITIDGSSNRTTTLAVGAVPNSLGVNPVTNRVYVANGSGNTVSLIDGATYSRATVPVGYFPLEVAVNPVTNKIYVANNDSTVTVIDGASDRTTSVTAGRGLVSIDVNPVTNRIYAANRDDNTVTLIDGVSNATTTIPVGSTPVSIAVNPTTNMIYVANNGDGTVTVINGLSNRTRTVVTGAGPTAVAVNPATNKVYVANYFSNDVTVIDGATNATSTVPAGTSPIAVAVNSQTDKIYVANFQGNNVTVIDGANNNTTMVNTDSAPLSVAVNPVTNKIYVANFGGNDVTVIDGASDTSTTIPIGHNPNSVTVNAVINKVYVVNYYGSNMGGSISVIDGASNSIRTLPVGNYPTALAFNPVTNKVYVGMASNNIVTVLDEEQEERIPLTTTIVPLPGDQTGIPDPSFTFSVRSGLGTTPERVYFQVDTWQNTWTAASGENKEYKGTTASLQPGFHILYAYAVDGQEATSTQLDTQVTGAIQAYGFLVRGFVVTPPLTTTRLSAKPAISIVGLPVVLTATVESTAGMPFGSVIFSYGSAVLGTETLDASGVANLTTTALPIGIDLVTATYVGNAEFSTSSGSFSEAVSEGVLPVAVSVSPNSGTATTQAFTAVYSDANGLSDLDTVRLLISSSDSTLKACYVIYSPIINSFYMTDDQGTEVLPPFTPGQAGAYASNNQCALAGPGSSVSISGNTIAVTFALKFRNNFLGAKNIYLQAVRRDGVSTGAVQKGTWRLPLTAGIILSRVNYKFTSNPQISQSGRVYVSNNTSQAISFHPTIQLDSSFQITKTCPVIEPNATCDFQITYTPTQAGINRAVLYLNPQNGPRGDSPSVFLDGNAVKPSVVLSATQLNFEASIGGADYEQLYITNNLPYTLNSHPALPSTEFSFANDCSAIAAFSTCALNVAFIPTLGEGIGEDLYLNYVNAPASTPSAVRVQASSALVPPIFVNTNYLQLVTATGTSISKTISISNNTVQTITSSPTITGTAAFTLSSTCSVVQPFQTCAINVNYAPTTNQIDTAKLALNFRNVPGRSPTTVMLEGFAPNPFRVSVDGHNTTSNVALWTNVGTFQTFVVTVLNGTYHSLSLAPFLSGSSSFKISQPCTSIPSHGICQMTVLFAPTSLGSSYATLNVNPTNLHSDDVQSVPLVKFSGSGL